MDIMRISSKFMKDIISKVIGSAVSKKLGCKADIHVDELVATFENEKASIRFNVCADMPQEELVKLLKSIGLN